MIRAAIKPKTCAVCKTKFEPRMPMAKVCSLDCAKSLAVSIRGKAEKVAAIKERKADAVKREQQKRISDLIREAQVAFNSFIRARDAKKPCICCGVPLGTGEVGGAFDCGHYRSVGSASHLRFDERNAHAQRKVCNRWGAGRAVDYRLGLIKRIGLLAVEALESDNAVHKWEREELKAIKSIYAAKAKAMKEAQQ
jgi:Bacteriophage Lambda NinG protein